MIWLREQLSWVYPVPLVSGQSEDGLGARRNAEAIFTSASTSTAMGVPVAPNDLPVVRAGSSTTGACSPIARLSSLVPVETTSKCGAPFGGLLSQASRIREHLLAEATAGVPEDHKDLVAVEIGQVDRLAGIIRQC